MRSGISIQRLVSVMDGQNRSVAAVAARMALACLEVGYRAILAARNFAFDAGLRRPRRLGRTTISIGNITTGGTGKTPFVMGLAKRLLAAGARPAVLLRGYAADASGSDEAQLMRQTLGQSVPVETGSDRLAAARRVLEAHPHIDVFLLDDGFQRRQVHRDLDLVLIDATQPFGFGRVLPRGLLREPVSSLQRADAVIVTRVDQVTPPEVAQLDGLIHQAAGKPPIAHTTHRWHHYTDTQGATRAMEDFKHARVVGVCGVGNPKAFEADLKRHVGQVLAIHTRPDHHAYSRDEIERMLDDAQAHHAQAIVITQKDMVKWRALLDRSQPPRPPVYCPIVSIEFVDGEAAVSKLLRDTRTIPVMEQP